MDFKWNEKVNWILLTETSNQRHRRYSSNTPLSASQVTSNLDHYGEIILHCPVSITKNIKDQGNVLVLRYICALLNSGGGILHMANVDLKVSFVDFAKSGPERIEVLSKHLDTWWSGMEIRLSEIISKDDICNYFDLVGNHDDPDLYVFVKTAEHLCTLSYHCRLPTDWSKLKEIVANKKMLMKYESKPFIVIENIVEKLKDQRNTIALDVYKADEYVTILTELYSDWLTPIFTDTATHDVTYQSMLRLLVNNGEPGSLEDLPTIPRRFVYGQSDSELKKETKQIQFKQLKQSKISLPERITALMKKYVSAFANHEGGHIYFGIDDLRASVIGEELNQSDQRKTEHMVESHLKNMIWGHTNITPVRGKHWEIQFIHVEQVHRKPARVVVVISIVKFPGGVFTRSPLSLFVTRDKKVEEFNFNEWKEAILNPLRDIPELHHRFLKLPMKVPLAPLIFTLPDTIETIKQKVLLGKACQIQPRQYIESFAKPHEREPVTNILKQLLSSTSVSLGLQCWGLNIPMINTDDIICDVAIVTEEEGLCVYTLSTSIMPHVYKHSQSAASSLKSKLVLEGGCTDKISVMCCVVNINQGIQNNQMSSDIYPSHFKINKQKYSNILKSFIIAMGSYKAKSRFGQRETGDKGYQFLLTCDQFELLWSQQFTKELWVHGPSGAGKTVAIIQMIEELRRRGCKMGNILYLAENEKLCDYLRSYNICLVTNRRTLLSEAGKNNLMDRKYSRVCNVFIDEAQNFKARDGDWYSLAEKLANQKVERHLFRCSNYFWLFMDYSQKVHKFEAGLPGVIGKNNFMLSEISRSTKEIFDFTSRLMTESEHVDDHFNPYKTVYRTPRLAHSYSSGKGVDILSCKDAEIKSLLNQVMSGLLQNGVAENDIAILVGKRRELEQVQTTLQGIHSDEGEKQNSKTRSRESIPNNRSIEQHLKECGSEDNIQPRSLLPSNTSGVDAGFYDDQDDSEDDGIEVSNPFNILSTINSNDSLHSNSEVINEVTGDSQVTMETTQNTSVSFYGTDKDDSDSELTSAKRLKSEEREFEEPKPVSMDTGFVVDTVRRFDGLHKPTVIGVNPYVNEEHADFKKFLVNLASRAKDNLIIITTSDSIRDQLQQYVK